MSRSVSMSVRILELTALCVLASVPAARAQAPAVRTADPSTHASTSTDSEPAYVLRSTTHLVLTDVVVTDANGTPVRGLPRSAFHLLDNNRPQPINSFEEHTDAALKPANVSVMPANTFSNDYLSHPPPVSNVVMLDTTNLAVVDQMYLYEQLQRLLAALPAGEALAVYTRSGSFALLLQNFTADHALLARAFSRAVPQLPNVDARESNDFSTLHQMASYLAQLSGRKNILWFSGGSHLALRQDPSALRVLGNLRPVYDELEAERISLYPIDARGLAGAGGGSSANGDGRRFGDQSGSQASLNVSPNRLPQGREGRAFGIHQEQNSLMEEEAGATGGRAFFNNNGITDFAAQVVGQSREFYTLTYTPHDLKFDNKWHKVKVVLDGGPYTLEYRRGYFDDAVNLPLSSRVAPALPGSDDAHRSNPRSEPIIFEVHAEPLADSTIDPAKLVPKGEHGAGTRNGTAYLVRYTLPAAAFEQRQQDGQSRVLVGTGVIAFNASGRLLVKLGREVSLTVDAAKLAAHPDGALRFDMEVDLPRGEDYLLVSAWDRTTGRIGTVQLPLKVKKRAAAVTP